MSRFLARDLVLTALTVAAFALDASMRASSGPLSIAVAVLAGVLATVVGFLVHEWGHLVGALVTGSVVHYPPAIASVFLFHFDTRANGRRQFLAMSLGGFVASVIALVALLLVLPLHALSGKVALALVAIGVVATFVLEVPEYLRVLRGAPMPDGFVYQPFETTRPNER